MVKCRVTRSYKFLLLNLNMKGNLCIWFKIQMYLIHSKSSRSLFDHATYKPTIHSMLISWLQRKYALFFNRFWNAQHSFLCGSVVKICTIELTKPLTLHLVKTPKAFYWFEHFTFGLIHFLTMLFCSYRYRLAYKFFKENQVQISKCNNKYIY